MQPSPCYVIEDMGVHSGALQYERIVGPKRPDYGQTPWEEFFFHSLEGFGRGPDRFVYCWEITTRSSWLSEVEPEDVLTHPSERVELAGAPPIGVLNFRQDDGFVWTLTIVDSPAIDYRLLEVIRCAPLPVRMRVFDPRIEE